MKRIIFVLLMVPVFCFAQNKKALTHFWDIPWGTSIERAETILKERGMETFRDENCLIAQGRYEGEEAAIMLLFNRVNRLYSGNVIYPSSATTALLKYDNYRKVLFRRYGMPDTAVEFFESPYRKGDGREIEAIRTENAFYFTEWQFKDDCLASISILKSLDVCLTFKNPVYADSELVRR
ncbi:MAG: hypothetical protein LBH42_08670 [Treponema sp.]|jgi:hypothetical protein|nr:hypothetical protein [Treponema sp.]